MNSPMFIETWKKKSHGENCQAKTALEKLDQASMKCLSAMIPMTWNTFFFEESKRDLFFFFKKKFH